MHGENPNFVLITVCTRSIKAELKQFVETHAMPGIHLLLEPERVPYQFGVIPLLKYLPGYVLLDKTGIIRVSEHTFSRGDFKFDHLITALLAEDPNADGERIIPQVNQFLANSYLVKNQTEKSIAEYEKMLAFTPNNLDIMMDIFNLKMFPSAETALMNRAYNRMLELNQLDQLSPELDVNIRYHILELVDLFAERGDREKTWTLFQVAVVHDDSAINHARQHKKRFAVIQDIPEFQKLLAETPQSEAERRSNELRRKREMYAEDLRAAHQSFTAVEADGEIFTGTILSQAGYILVPASVARAEVIRVKIVNYQPAKIVAVDAESELAVVQVDGQRNLRPVVLGTVDDLREHVPIPLPKNLAPGYGYPRISMLSARNAPYNFTLQLYVSIIQFEIDDDGKVTTLKAESRGDDRAIIRGDVLVYYDGRLLAVSLENEVRHDEWGKNVNLLPIDQIRAALERMNVIDLMKK